jgi:hypothetical protein
MMELRRTALLRSESRQERGEPDRADRSVSCFVRSMRERSARSVALRCDVVASTTVAGVVVHERGRRGAGLAGPARCRRDNALLEDG